MLTWIRKKSSGLLMTMVMGLLILAFAFWGVGDYFTQSSNDSLATVNGENITYSDFTNQFNTYRQNMMSQFGDGVDPSYFDTPIMRRNFLESMINSELVRQVAEDNGYTVTAAEIKKVLEDVPAFKNDQGQFDKSRYAAYLSQTNQSAQLLQMRIEDDQAGAALNGMFDESAFVTPYKAKKIAALNKQTRDFDYVTISPNQFTEQMEVSEEEINDYFSENSSQYMTAEMVSVNYIELDSLELASEIEIDEVAAVEYFENNKERFRKAEQRQTAHILISDGDDSADLLAEVQAKLTAGEAFDELAKTYSKDPGSAASGGDLGWVSPGDMVEEFDEALFAMQVGTVSEPVKTQFGYHIIKLNEVKAAELPVYEEVKADIIQELQANESETVFLNKAGELSELVLDAQVGLEPVAEATGYEIQTTELFARTGGLGIAANPTFAQAAFSPQVKDELLNSDAINLSDTQIVFMHLNEVKDAELKPLEDVKESIITAIKK